MHSTRLPSRRIKQPSSASPIAVCSIIHVLETLPDGGIIRFTRQQVGEFQKFQLAGGVAEHTQKTWGWHSGSDHPG